MGRGAKDDAAPVEPSFPPGMADPFETLNVDGGITNNDPYNYAHDYLAGWSRRARTTSWSAIRARRTGRW